MFEKIGNVTLDTHLWTGEDRYSDGDAVENEIMQLVQKHSESELESLAITSGSWPILYHLSPLRKNIIEWYPFEKESRILELGAGCGAVTGALLQRELKVTCVDLSKRRSLINAFRHKYAAELSIIVGSMNDYLDNTDDVFDYVLLLGVFEYASVFSDEQDAHLSLLKRVRHILNPGGSLFLAIENRLGMKYFAGAREDHTGKFFDGIQGYSDISKVRTFSRNELIKLAEEAEFSWEFYYPYPDYKFPTEVFSDKRLPKQGELKRNWQTLDTDRLILFDENRAFDGIIRAGLFQEFSNSFLMKLTKEAGR